MTRAAALLVFASMVAAPAVSLAADDAHGAHDAAEAHGEHGDHGPLTIGGVLKSPEFIGTVVNFLVLLALIAWVIRTKGNPALAARRKAVEADLAEAQRLRAELTPRDA